MELYALRFYSDDKYDQSQGNIIIIAGFDTLKNEVKSQIVEEIDDYKFQEELIEKKLKELDDVRNGLEGGYDLYICSDNQIYIQEMSDYSCEQAKKYADTQTEKQDGIVEIVMMKIHGIDVFVEKGQATNFDYRISKNEAEQLMIIHKGKLPFDIMCKEYGDDEDWVAMSIEDINEDNEFDDDYKTFEIYNNPF